MNELEVGQSLGFLAALGAGLAIGIERERAKGDGAARESAGVRTFAIAGLFGAVCAAIGLPFALFGGAAVALFAFASYRRTAKTDPGLTTELALVLTYALGVLALANAQLAAAVAIAATILLDSKQWLHAFTRQTLSERELDDALILAASVLIVLPLLPDRALDPLGVINPRRLWLIAVLVMALNAAGYVAVRLLGARYGLAIAGFAGGFVSSTATHNSMGQRFAGDPKLFHGCVAGALLSNVATMVSLALILAAVSPALLAVFAWPLAAAGTVAALSGGVFAWQAGRETGEDAPTADRPFRLWHALLFAGIVAAALLASALARHWLGDGGTVIAAALTGLADVHAAAVSLGQQIGASLDPSHAEPALLAAISTNSLMKCIAAFSGGGRRFGLAATFGQLAINAAAWSVFAYAT